MPRLALPSATPGRWRSEAAISTTETNAGLSVAGQRPRVLRGTRGTRALMTRLLRGSVFRGRQGPQQYTDAAEEEHAGYDQQDGVQRGSRDQSTHAGCYSD